MDIDEWVKAFDVELEKAKCPEAFTEEQDQQDQQTENIIDTCNNPTRIPEYFEVIKNIDTNKTLLIENKKNNVKCKPLKMVNRFSRLRYFEDTDEQQKYFLKQCLHQDQVFLQLVLLSLV